MYTINRYSRRYKQGFITYVRTVNVLLQTHTAEGAFPCQPIHIELAMDQYDFLI